MSASHVSDEFLAFTGSVHFDRRLWKHDIAGSIAHVHALALAGVLTKSGEGHHSLWTQGDSEGVLQRGCSRSTRAWRTCT